MHIHKHTTVYTYNKDWSTKSTKNTHEKKTHRERKLSTRCNFKLFDFGMCLFRYSCLPNKKAKNPDKTIYYLWISSSVFVFVWVYVFFVCSHRTCDSEYISPKDAAKKSIHLLRNAITSFITELSRIMEWNFNAFTNILFNFVYWFSFLLPKKNTTRFFNETNALIVNITTISYIYV